MNTAMRDRYLTDSVTTASPQTLLVRLYERLVLDLRGAEHAVASGDTARSNDLLTHAQDILVELAATLDVEAWSGGPALAQLYDFALRELVEANVAKDAGRVTSVRELLEPLLDAWREAATAPAGATTSLSA